MLTCADSGQDAYDRVGSRNGVVESLQRQRRLVHPGPQERGQNKVKWSEANRAGQRQEVSEEGEQAACRRGI